MKKTLVITLALVFVLGLAGTAFAANPFTDVPAKHWAYDAVSKLQKAGIVDGYSDGTFKGDKPLTRYELAIVTAKALAKSEKASAENKALIDKLATEFKSELDNLGVRVAALESKVDNVKLSGFVRAKYGSDTVEGTPRASSASRHFLFVLNGDAKVNDTTTAHFGTENRYGYSVNGNNWGGAYKDDSATSGQNAFFRAWVDTKVGNSTITVGRRWAGVGDCLFIGTEMNGLWVDLPLGDSTKATLFYVKNTNQSDGNLTRDTDAYGINLNADLSKTVNANLVVGGNKKNDGTLNASGIQQPFSSWGQLTMNAKLAQDWNLCASYGKTNADTKSTEYNIQLNYKGADSATPQTWGAYVRYFNIGYNTAPLGDTAWNTYFGGSKGWTVGFDYTVAKNVVWSSFYSNQKGDDLNRADFANKTRKLVRTQFDFNF